MTILDMQGCLVVRMMRKHAGGSNRPPPRSSRQRDRLHGGANGEKTRPLDRFHPAREFTPVLAEAAALLESD
jgi:hypothetical protein